jgi:hypothetical protein
MVEQQAVPLSPTLQGGFWPLAFGEQPEEATSCKKTAGEESFEPREINRQESLSFN